MVWVEINTTKELFLTNLLIIFNLKRKLQDDVTFKVLIGFFENVNDFD
jgi:hypothetical protein